CRSSTQSSSRPSGRTSIRPRDAWPSSQRREMMRRPSFLSFFLSFRPSVKGVVALSAVMLLSGCASFSSDGGIGDVSAMTSERIGQPVQQASLDQSDTNQQTVRAMLAKPLDADSAVRIALLNNRGLQASLAELGVAEAD